MIKKIVLGFGLSILSLAGLRANALGIYSTVGIDSFASPVNSAYSITPLKGGGFLSNYLGVGKSVLAWDNQRLFWWTKNGYPYAYLKSNNSFVGTEEGFFDRYYSCDSFVGSGVLTNCSYSMIDYSGGTSDFDKQVFKSFFKSVIQGDYFYTQSEDYRYIGATWSYALNYVRVCWNSEELGKSFCFMGGRCTDSSSNCQNLGGLVNSQHLKDQFDDGLTFGLLNNNWIGYAPGQNGYDGQFQGSSEGSSEGFLDNQLTGDYTYADCTWNDILIALESEGYNKYVCYGGLDNFDLYDSSINYNPIAGNGLSISQIWAWSGSRAWDNFPEWFTFWNGLYLDSSNNNYNSMWESYPAVYRTYFQIYNAYKGSVLDPRTVLEYCQLRTLTGNQLNNSAGGYFKPVCETVVREKQTGLWDCRVNGTLYSGCDLNPQVAIGTNWNGVGNMSGVTAQSDGLNFIQNFFNLAKSNLLTNYSGTLFGIVPFYIIVFMIALILFRFISH